VRRKKSFVRIFFKWLFVGFLPLLIAGLMFEYLRYGALSSFRDSILMAIITSPFAYFGIPYFFNTMKDIGGLFRQANWIQKLILGIFAFLIFGRIIRVIIQTFNQS